MDIQEVVFLDFEASSLSNESWPIEIGMSWLGEGGKVMTESDLIKPSPLWDLDDWSTASACVHNIRMADLMKSADAHIISEKYRELLHGKCIISDNPRWEAMWLNRLFEAGEGKANVQINSLHQFVDMTLDEYAKDKFYEKIRITMTPHRAGPDSAKLLKCWLFAVEFNEDPEP